MTVLVDGGVAVDLPPGWDGQIRGVGGPIASVEELGAADVGGPVAGGIVLHAASFALPAERGDYGSGAVEVMTGSDVLVCLLEHEPEAASTALFATEGVPRLDSSMFSPDSMQRTIAGMAGAQQFFQVGGRPFCLYVVVGSWHTRGPLVTTADNVAASIRITA